MDDNNLEKPKKRKKTKKNFPSDHEKKIHKVGREEPKYKLNANNWQDWDEENR